MSAPTTDPDVRRFRREMKRRRPKLEASLGQGSATGQRPPSMVFQSDAPPAPVQDHLNRLAIWLSGGYDEAPVGGRT